MVVDLKEKQLVGMMPGGVHFILSWDRLVRRLREVGDIEPDETVTHIGSDLHGLTFLVERNPV